MKRYFQAVVVWMLIIPLAVLNGGLRDRVIAERFGEGFARPLSAILLAACIVAMAWLLLPRIKGTRTRDYFGYGVVWFILTNTFDLIGVVSSGGTVQDYFAMFDMRTGEWWALVVLSALLAPISLVGRR